MAACFASTACSLLPVFKANELGARARENEITTHFELAAKTIHLWGVAKEKGFLEGTTALVTRFDEDGAVTRAMHGVKGSIPYIVVGDLDTAPILCLFDHPGYGWQSKAGLVPIGATIALRGVVVTVRRDTIVMKNCGIRE